MTAIIAAASALLGAGLASRAQLRAARETQEAQYQLESLKIEAATDEKRRAATLSNYAEAHKALSFICREYSLTSLDIMENAKTSKLEYDKRYIEGCERLDTARATIEIHFNEAYSLIEEIYGQMNIFWGNFTEVASLIENDEPYEKYKSFHEKAVQASLKISALSVKCKAAIRAKAQQGIR
ncbi:hypothetical protein ACIPZF_01360 [Pseudomonas sp. NPDC089752]|uniref:hypothetical protein n=1 Tax=Pseudomonas sp. NPDC089752 TaxID=3364472 RepID=UPI0037FF1DD3